MASFIVVFALLPCGIRMALDSGTTWDETVQREYGHMIVSWYRSGFRDASATRYRNLYLYGGLFSPSTRCST